ncbi:hypothetical protein HUT18_11660 [Streptomyces sp. NA04227]|uniref:hypothetical protein n=1 Tax=Streptomyces sp. NA04227 TaxID=2742136 RepID=UPI0015911185|nr:hypothetical protein [Streptomyces sp. NA04227]QKW06954.1 hypothetical protein HUT18_11660 [Streptomyces sp. NA04227]
MHRVMVSNNYTDKYPACVDADERHDEGWVRPYFDLDTVRELAANTQAAAAEFGHDAIDTVHVIDAIDFIDGEVDEDPWSLVVVISWMDIAVKGVDGATTIVTPRYHREDGGDYDPEYQGEPLYAIGGFPWCWYAIGPDGIHPQIPFRPER